MELDPNKPIAKIFKITPTDNGSIIDFEFMDGIDEETKEIIREGLESGELYLKAVADEQGHMKYGTIEVKK